MNPVKQIVEIIAVALTIFAGVAIIIALIGVM
jgi:hypothetical protein